MLLLLASGSKGRETGGRAASFLSLELEARRERGAQQVHLLLSEDSKGGV